jgi:hypothetical protein
MPARESAAEKPVTLTREAALAVYTREAICDLGKFIFGEYLKPDTPISMEKCYPCKNENGDIEFIEARFDPECFANGQKRTAAMWWNGKRLKAKNNPHGLFGRELLAADPDKPVLIVEGPKCQAAAAEKLPDFIPIAWNGGASGQKRIDFSPLQGRRVYIYPDDDEPGGKSARETAKMLQGAASGIVIVNPLPEARTVKPAKADIIEALQVRTPEEITGYILNHTPPEPQAGLDDPYMAAGVFLTAMGFYKVYDKKSVFFYSEREDRVYSYTEIREKFAEDKIQGLNPAKMAKMIDNLNPAYPVYSIVKSFEFGPRYRGRDTHKGDKYVINTWDGFAYPRETPVITAEAEIEAEFVKEHIRRIICGGDNAVYQHQIRWIAHIVQFPDIKPGVAIYAHSECQGTGKSLVFEQLIPNILGKENTISFSNKDQLGEKFNSWLFETIYAVLSENNFYENTENIKSWITETDQSRRDMGIKSENARSFTRFVICTNKETSFHFEESERRMFVLEVSDEAVKYPKKEHDLYFTRLATAVNNPCVLDALALFFNSVDLSDFNPFDYPVTQKKRDIIKSERNGIIDFFDDVIFGGNKNLNITNCKDAVTCEHYYKSDKLYEALAKFADIGEFYFIEVNKLFNYWKETQGRQRKENISWFSRIISNYYGDKIEIINKMYRDEGRVVRRPVYIIRGELLNDS